MAASPMHMATDAAVALFQRDYRSALLASRGIATRDEIDWLAAVVSNEDAREAGTLFPAERVAASKRYIPAELSTAVQMIRTQHVRHAEAARNEARGTSMSSRRSSMVVRPFGAALQASMSTAAGPGASASSRAGFGAVPSVTAVASMGASAELDEGARERKERRAVEQAEYKERQLYVAVWLEQWHAIVRQYRSRASEISRTHGLELSLSNSASRGGRPVSARLARQGSQGSLRASEPPKLEETAKRSPRDPSATRKTPSAATPRRRPPSAGPKQRGSGRDGKSATVKSPSSEFQRPQAVPQATPADSRQAQLALGKRWMQQQREQQKQQPASPPGGNGDGAAALDAAKQASLLGDLPPIRR